MFRFAIHMCRKTWIGSGWFASHILTRTRPMWGPYDDAIRTNAWIMILKRHSAKWIGMEMKKCLAHKHFQFEWIRLSMSSSVVVVGRWECRNRLFHLLNDTSFAQRHSFCIIAQIFRFIQRRTTHCICSIDAVAIRFILFRVRSLNWAEWIVHVISCFNNSLYGIFVSLHSRHIPQRSHAFRFVEFVQMPCTVWHWHTAVICCMSNCPMSRRRRRATHNNYHVRCGYLFICIWLM